MKVSIAVCLLATAAAIAVPEGVDPPENHVQLFPCCMTRYSTPIKVSGVLGLSFNKTTGEGIYHGPFVQLEPGWGGGKVTAGYRLGMYRFLPIWNIGASASLLQTWGDPLQDVEPDQTYIGAELSCAFSVIGLNGGVFMHVAGDDDEHDWIYSLGAGVGF